MNCRTDGEEFRRRVEGRRVGHPEAATGSIVGDQFSLQSAQRSRSLEVVWSGRLILPKSLESPGSSLIRRGFGEEDIGNGVHKLL